MNLKFVTGFAAGGVVLSSTDTDKETSWTWAGAGNREDGERGTDSSVVTGPYKEKYEIDLKNVTSADTKYFLVDGL